jgi:hypothetical protein
MFNEIHLQWVGCTLALCGSALLAAKGRVAGWGFALFLLSNVVWIAYGVLTSAPGLVVMQVGFTVTSLWGLWTWVVAPMVSKTRTDHPATGRRGRTSEPLLVLCHPKPSIGPAIVRDPSTSSRAFRRS